jgi:hypothetical protein
MGDQRANLSLAFPNFPNSAPDRVAVAVPAFRFVAVNWPIALLSLGVRRPCVANEPAPDDENVASFQ